MTIKYTKDHEWVSVQDDIATVGITDYAQEQLGDVVFVELPSVGSSVSANEEISTIESVKAASDIYAPVSGEVIEVNENLEGEPSMINSDPLKSAWIFKIKMSDQSELDELLDENAYNEIIA